jgi:predicted permease
MDSPLLFAVNATLPIVLMVVIGYVIKKIGLLKADTAKILNNIVFRVLLPAMLFLNIYKIEDLGSINLNYVWYVLGFTIGLFLLFIPIVNLFFPIRNQRGVILQSIFRSNYALIGIPLATALDAVSGAAIASLLAAFIVPVFNVLGVICLCIYSDEEKPSVKGILINIAKNPLIFGVAMGLVALGIRAIFTNVGIEFRLTEIVPVYKVLEYLSSAATPLALLALGAQFEFSAIPALKKQIGFGIALRSVLIPSLALSVAYLIGGFNGAHFAAFVAMFATPVAVSTVPMCQSMGADHNLAGQLVVWTTTILTYNISIYIINRVSYCFG